MNQPFNTQITRIKQKLSLLAGKYSPDLYKFKPPVPEETVVAFEKKYGIQLPECYRLFILEVGNGGYTEDNSGPGPYYGLYPFDMGVYDLSDTPQTSLGKECLLYPEMTQQQWKALWDTPGTDVFSGLLPVGHQGCGSVHAIILNGELAGKVIYLDFRQYPFFTYEKNFLDWYERWLDERLSGEPERGFGLFMNGTPEELLLIYLHAKEKQQQLNALQALKAKKQLPAEIISALQATWNKKEKETSQTLLTLLTKHNYEIAKPYLTEYFSVDPSSVINCISWFAENKKEEWIAPVLQQLIYNTNPTFFEAAGNLLQSFDKQTTLKVYRQLAVYLQSAPDQQAVSSARNFLAQKLEFYHTTIECIREMPEENLIQLKSKLEISTKEWTENGELIANKQQAK